MDIQPAYEQFKHDCHDVTIGRLSDITISNYANTWRLFLQLFPITTFSQLNEGILQQFFRRGIVQRGWKPATEATHRKGMSKFIKWAISKDYLAGNPLDKIKYPEIIEQLPDFYSEKELSKIIYYASATAYTPFLKSRDSAIIASLAMGGFRRTELTSLTMRDVDMNGKRIEIRGETAKNRHPRVIKMSLRLQQYLQTYLEARVEKGIDTFKFWASERNQPFTNDGLKHLLKNISNTSGVKVGSQKMRRTAATNFYAGKKDIMATKEFLGHREIQTTMRYARVTAADMEDAIEKNPINLIF